MNGKIYGMPWLLDEKYFYYNEKMLADAGISLDAIVQSERLRPAEGGGSTSSRDMSFVLRRGDRPAAEAALKPLLAQWPGASFEEASAIARVSAVGRRSTVTW